MRFPLRVIVAVVLGLGSLVAAPATQVNPGTALRIFQDRISAYAALHRRVAETQPALERSGSIHSILRARAALGYAIRTARPAAREGDVFTADVAHAFRRLIEVALEGVDSEALLRDLYGEEAAPPGLRPRVHDAYPDWATHEVPVVLLQTLPRLPGEVQYRLIDHALVVWDADADLIVDVLPDAIPGPTS